MRSRRRACGSSTHAADQPEPVVVDLGGSRALWRAVVKEHHVVGQRHRAGGPGDDRWRDERRHMEEVQGAHQNADMPAGDDQPGRLLRASGAPPRGARR